jgi:amidophosphoribosyltransferase
VSLDWRRSTISPRRSDRSDSSRPAAGGPAFAPPDVHLQAAPKCPFGVPYLPAHDGLYDECGVFGVYGVGEAVTRVTFFGLFALQHRGQESAGIAVADGSKIRMTRQMGLVTQIFSEDTLRALGQGHIALGHVRYSTTGGSRIQNAQPVLARGKRHDVCLAHNGNLVNAYELREELKHKGARFEGTSDTEVMARMIADSPHRDVEEAVKAMVAGARGAYSLIVMTHDRLIAIRDAYGVRPLCLGQLNGDSYVIASETCALNVIGARFLREIEPGEMVTIGKNGIVEQRALAARGPKFCMFEFVYLARPDSYLFGKSLHMVRRRMGHELAAEHPADAHIVVPVPDSGTPAAIGFAEASRIQYQEGMIKSRYIHRTFIQPDQRIRELGVQMKLTPLRENLAGKRVVLVDDSIVRGTTTKQTVRMLRQAGAREVHVRVSSSPYKNPCFYGIDTPDKSELIASRLPDVEAIRQHIGATSLGYLSIRGMTRAVGLPKNTFCLACFDGNYCIEIPSHERRRKAVLEEV